MVMNPLSGPGNYSPMANGTAGPGAGGANYNLSGASNAYGQMQNAQTYKPQSYSAFNFNTPNYNMTPQSTYNNAYSSAYKSGAAPITAQGKAQMQSLGQGFNAAGGRTGSAAQSALAMQNAQATGTNLSNLSNTLSANQQQNQLTENQNANQNVFNANMTNQLNQSNANFASAGFNDQEAQMLSNLQMSQANNLFNMGAQYPQLQAYLTGNERNAWQQTLGNLSSLSGLPA